MPAPDYTDKFNTTLPKDDEASFQDWLKKSGREGDLRDYDLRGWWKNSGGRAPNGHFPDTYKKPNHPTFSDESVYSKGQTTGGHWSGDDKSGWSFTPSKTNLSNMTTDELQAYFRKVEPGSKLALPQSAPDRRYGGAAQ